jgi:hypothetical protein
LVGRGVGDEVRLGAGDGDGVAVVGVGVGVGLAVCVCSDDDALGDGDSLAVGVGGAVCSPPGSVGEDASASRAVDCAATCDATEMPPTTIRTAASRAADDERRTRICRPPGIE